MGGVSLAVLLDLTDPFLPPEVAEYFQETDQGKNIYSSRYFLECELIYQAVGDKTWRELEIHVETMVALHETEVRRVKEMITRSYNFLSSEVRANWSEAKQVWYQGGATAYGTRYYSGYHLVKHRERFIEHFNRAHPEQSPPLDRADDLTRRLVLPSWDRYWCLAMRSRGITRKDPTELSAEERAHFRRKGVHLPRIPYVPWHEKGGDRNPPSPSVRSSSPPSSDDPTSMTRPAFKVRVD